MTPRLFVALSGIVLLVSGCTSDPQGLRGEAPEGRPASEGDPPRLEVELEGCMTSHLTGAIPGDWGDPFIAEGFEPLPILVDEYEVILEMRDCDRAVFDGQVAEHVRWLDASIIVGQNFDEESIPGGLLVAASFLNDEALAAALRGVGVSPTMAKIEPTREPLLGGSTMTGWSIAGDGFAYSYEFPLSPGDTAKTEVVGVWWHAGPPHARDDSTAVLRRQPTQEHDVVTLHLEGDTSLDRMFGGNAAWPFLQFLYFDGHETHRFTGGFVP